MVNLAEAQKVFNLVQGLSKQQQFVKYISNAGPSLRAARVDHEGERRRRDVSSCLPTLAKESMFKSDESAFFTVVFRSGSGRSKSTLLAPNLAKTEFFQVHLVDSQLVPDAILHSVPDGGSAADGSDRSGGSSSGGDSTGAGSLSPPPSVPSPSVPSPPLNPSPPPTVSSPPPVNPSPPPPSPSPPPP
ncbi:unnamed protein product [Closterium sp. NIES-64]|nr:unnamed protein product [Closterium sp. NIES-64]